MRAYQAIPHLGGQDHEASLLVKARIARRELRRWAMIFRYGRRLLADAPIHFANSFPKSGTHLLTQVLKGFTKLGPAVDSGLPAIVTFQGETGLQRSGEEITNDFKSLLPGDIAYGHVHATPDAVAILCHEGFAAYFILRDPRDVAVSHVHYITDMAPQHIHHSYYKGLSGFNERLHASIAGFKHHMVEEDVSAPTALPNIRERFEPFLGWLDRSEVLWLQFEDFAHDRHAAVAQVFDHAVQRGFESRLARNEAIPILMLGINPERSPTFRRGKTGEWRASFTQEHKTAFKEITGDLLIRLGYEENNDW